MSDKTIFLAYAFDDYECPCVPIKAFASKVVADAFVQKCRDYQDMRPRCPFSLDAETTDEDWAAYEKWQSEVEEPWQNNHPAGLWNHDGFAVDELPMDVSK